MLCPKFSWLSVICLFSLIQILIFITEISLGGISNSSLLAAQQQTLTSMGDKDPLLMRNKYEIWRFFTPIFLHVNLVHLGFWRFSILYVLSGIGGNLFSALCDNRKSCGASTAIYGLIGSYGAVLIINWTYFSDRLERKC